MLARTAVRCAHGLHSAHGAGAGYGPRDDDEGNEA